jgi:hypothetical protein
VVSAQRSRAGVPAVKNIARSTRRPPNRERSAASAWSISNPDILVPQEGHYEGGVPSPRFHLLRFHGLLAPHAKARAQIIPRGRATVDQDGGPGTAGLVPGAAPAAPPTAGAAGLSWATLMKRVFALDVLRCPRCGGPRRIVGVYSGGPRLRELLARVGLGARSSRPPPQPAAKVTPTEGIGELTNAMTA